MAQTVVTLQNYRDLLMPAVTEHMRRISTDPFQRCEEMDLRVDKFGGRLVLEALWKDGSIHTTYIPWTELFPSRQSGFDLFKAALRKVAPEHTFEDEITIAYDDSGWL